MVIIIFIIRRFMSKKVKLDEQLHLAVYLLKNRFHTPGDLLKYWAFSGPCTESHPEIEDFKRGE
jgi:hypothetical protein